MRAQFLSKTKIVIIDFVNTIKKSFICHMSFTLAILTHCWMMQILKTKILPLHSLLEKVNDLSIFQDKNSECSLSDPLSDSFKPCLLIEKHGRKGVEAILP